MIKNNIVKSKNRNKAKMTALHTKLFKIGWCILAERAGSK